MKHREVRAQLGAYLEGELPLAGRAVLDAHLEDCAACALHLRQLRSTIDALRCLDDPEPPPGLAEAVLRRIATGEGAPTGLARLLERIPWSLRSTLATPALALVSLGLLFLWLRTPPQAPAPAVVPTTLGESVGDSGRIGTSAPRDLGEPADANAGAQDPVDATARAEDDLRHALRDPSWLLQETASLDPRVREARLAALAQAAGHAADLAALAQALRALPDPRGGPLAESLERLAGPHAPR